MVFPLQQMSIREHAELEIHFGARIIHRQGRFWRRVRPFFYRPVHGVEPVTEVVVPPPGAWLGGYQYAVADVQRANSTLNFVMLDQLRTYSLENLGHRRRNLIRQASRHFHVRRVENLDELKNQGYLAYRSFYERTRYSYRTDRLIKEKFDAWAETLFCHPKAILLGGYCSTGLMAVSCSYWIENSLNYTTFYAETGCLRRNIGEVMLHELRLIAAAEPGIREILIRPYRGGESMDQYYLLRGGKVVRKPARLELSRLGHALLSRLRPADYALLTGQA